MRNLTDHQLFDKLCREGNFLAYRELFDRFWLKLYVTAKVRLQDEDEAKDCVQEVFISIWLKKDTLVIPDHVQAYLHTILKNKILNLLHQKTTTQRHLERYMQDLDLLVEPLESEMEYRELESLIAEEIDQMPQQMRRIFLMSRDEGLSGAQIAESLNLSHQTVRNQISTSLKRLRKRIMSFKNPY
ncbi:RNA polymerase sigma-70 factor (ECF subfamily) [Dyadobacter jejuensis]|uniref:RNA polymerase sigma-70 factor (ECF subfamily) n=1 Tax=Dyadobacter jejuensis TaxID=1082580 RepID=A0A316A9Z8_9BACT|nr:RNA polymerase sigma-70 factor [Dyadobacter jejuensis]PWJ54483.1 RNA polymerase sigma-70 factor (ECF subfamily) [Dyadobacter jejuensis]